MGTQKRRGRRLGVSKPRAQESETLSFAANGEETLRANAEREAFPGIPMQAISDEAETTGDYGLGIQTVSSVFQESQSFN